MGKKRAITDINAPNGSRDIPFQRQEFEDEWKSPFCRFSASFSLKYVITDAILQNSEKMKVQYLRNLLFDCLKFCWLLEVSHMLPILTGYIHAAAVY